MFLNLRQSHVEALVVEIHQLVQICGSAIVEIRRTGGEAAQYRAFDPLKSAQWPVIGARQLSKSFSPAEISVRA